MSLSNVVSNSLSGFSAFTKKLDDLSHNVANMNSVGFKKKETFFQEVNDNGGNGVHLSNERVSFSNGDIYSTGENTDLAIEGEGFFIVRSETGTSYTRAGQFVFDSGVLVDSNTGGEVLSITDSGELVNIDISDMQFSSYEPTSEVSLTGNLSSLSADDIEFPSEDESPISVDVVDFSGRNQKLSITYTKQSTDDWLAEVTNESGEIVGSDTLKFTAAGSPVSGFNTINVALELDNGKTQNIVFSAGKAGEFTGLTSFPSQTNALQLQSIDGRSFGTLQDISFDSSGSIILTYTNGDIKKPYSLGLALFVDKSVLSSINNSHFYSDSDPSAIASADEKMVGYIKAQSLERSNVDVTDEFSEIVIIQRGYQACSQVLTISNQMIEELYNSAKGG
ncbi:flagellar hook-basal body complex protein [Microbulbifer sp. ANSA003]|uniref:flagellar hook-basal body complex protein n=1 Tax=unclassified Microbulbifer TaxID=2619833 RepID=UPI004039EC8F